MKVILILVFSIALAISAAAAAVTITEVMYDPYQCSDNYCEWIELYNSDSSQVNLSDWIISDMDSDLSQEYNHSIAFVNQTNISANGYFIIARKSINFSQYWSIISPIAEFSTSGLNNGPEIIRLYSSNGSLVDEFYYNASYGANGDDDSLQKINYSGINNILNWCAVIPTPGALNNCAQQNEEEDEPEDESDEEMQSEIKITDAPDEARFGESIDVEIEVYKGDSSKYAVYVYVEDDEGNKVSDKITEHFHEKFSSDTAEVELQLKCINESDSYEIVAEGLGEEDREDIEISSCSDDVSEERSAQEKQFSDTGASNAVQEADGGQNYLPLSSNAILETESFSLKGAMPYFLATLCALAAIYVMIKKI